MKPAIKKEGPTEPKVPVSGSTPVEPDDKVSDPLSRLESRVFQPLKKRFYEPLNRIVDRLGYIQCVLLLLVFTSVSTLIVRVWNNPDQARDEITVARFYFEARKTVPPRPAEAADSVRDLTNRLKDFIAPGNRDISAWTAAQVTVSLQEQDAFDVPEMTQWLSSKAGACHCWHDVDEYSHLGASAWVLLAFARMNARPTEQEIEFVLESQHRPGWWSTFTSTDEPENAATYPTALCTLALTEVLQRDLIAPAQKERVAEAVRKGRNWLLNNSIPGKPGRWRDYPNGGYGTESIGASGLALHVLHRTPGPAPVTSDRYWMEHLPSELPQPDDSLSSGQIIHLADQPWHNDATHHFAFPWLIVGTVDAYSNGTLVQRAKAARLLHKVGEKQDAIEEGSKGKPWLAAETLIALRYLRGDGVI